MTRTEDSTGKQSQTQLIRDVVHDLKTPVASAKGFLDLVQNVGPLNDLQQKYMNRTFTSLENMEQLIETLLNWARLEAGTPLDMAVVDLCSIVSEVGEQLTPMAAQRRIQITTTCEELPASVPGDERLLRHVVTNLMSNAIKYNREDGTVSVTLHRVASGIQVNVQDDGIGIPEKDHERVFERFYRASRKGTDGRRIEGTGLGLAISRTVIELHGGKIWLNSAPGEGSIFSFILPAQARTGDYRSDALPGDQHPQGGAGEVSDDVDDDYQESPQDDDRDSRGEND